MFRTQDLGLIAALQVNGISPAGSQFEQRRLVCQFDDTPDVVRLREAYYAGRLRGPLSVFNSIVRMLTVQIREAR